MLLRNIQLGHSDFAIAFAKVPQADPRMWPDWVGIAYDQKTGQEIYRSASRSIASMAACELFDHLLPLGGLASTQHQRTTLSKLLLDVLRHDDWTSPAQGWTQNMVFYPTGYWDYRRFCVDRAGVGLPNVLSLLFTTRRLCATDPEHPGPAGYVRYGYLGIRGSIFILQGATQKHRYLPYDWFTMHREALQQDVV